MTSAHALPLPTCVIGLVTARIEDRRGRLTLTVLRWLMHVRCVRCQEAWPVSDGEIDERAFVPVGPGFDLEAMACSACGARYEVDYP